MANTDTWNAAFEALPADVDNISEGAERIRDTKLAVRERLSKDHYIEIAGTDADHGEHNKVTLRVQTSKPTAEANKGYVYSKDVSAKAELHYEDEDGNEIQITTGGSLNITALLLTHLATIYPIGCIYTTTVATNPATVFGFGTWEAFAEGEVLVGKASTGTFDTAGEEGGEETHALVLAELAAHTHSVSSAGQAVDSIGSIPLSGSLTAGYTYNTASTGSGTAHNNLQPYIVVYFWKRTA
jgi:hypothetical protein